MLLLWLFLTFLFCVVARVAIAIAAAPGGNDAFVFHVLHVSYWPTADANLLFSSGATYKILDRISETLLS